MSSELKNIKAMLFAAGLGTRLKPWTDSHPKALVPVAGKSLLQRNIEYLAGYGITNVVVNVHHFADQIINAILGAVILDESVAVLSVLGSAVTLWGAWLAGRAR